MDQEGFHVRALADVVGGKDVENHERRNKSKERVVIEIFVQHVEAVVRLEPCEEQVVSVRKHLRGRL